MICTFRDSIKVGSCLILPVFFGETERVRANVGCGSAPWGYDMHTSRCAVLTQVNNKAWRFDSLIPPSRGVKTVKSHPELGALTAGFRHTFMSPSRYCIILQPCYLSIILTRVVSSYLRIGYCIASGEGPGIRATTSSSTINDSILVRLFIVYPPLPHISARFIILHPNNSEEKITE